MGGSLLVSSGQVRLVESGRSVAWGEGGRKTSHREERQIEDLVFLEGAKVQMRGKRRQEGAKERKGKELEVQLALCQRVKQWQ